MPCVLAVDAGTTSIRCLAVDSSGEVVEVAQRPLTQHFPRPGWVEHDAAEIWEATVTTLREVADRLAQRGRRPVALGLTNQRETVVAWDRRDGRPVHRAVVWQDRRTAGRCEQLVRDGHLPLIRRCTGLMLDPYFSGTKMAWLLEDGGLRRGALLPHLALGTVDAWLVWNLTGGPDRGAFVTDVTNASRTMLWDIHQQTWSEELAELLEVPLAVLPDVRPSSGRLGRIRSVELAGTVALRDLPVSGVAGDQHAALFGQACFAPGMAKVTYGTGSFALLNCGPEPPEPPRGALVTPAWDLGAHGEPDPVHFAIEGSVFNSGSAIQWLRDGLGLIAAADQMEELASSAGDSGGVSLVPAFTGLGSPWWDARARGAVVGLTRGTTRGHLARAVVDAMAFQVRDMVEAMAPASPVPLTAMRADGGAAVMDLLLQLQADQLGVPVARPRSVETTGLGAATLAGLAEGVWPDLEALGRLWQPEVECRPSVPGEVADASYRPWLRAIGAARGWARD